MSKQPQQYVELLINAKSANDWVVAKVNGTILADNERFTVADVRSILNALGIPCEVRIFDDDEMIAYLSEKTPEECSENKSRRIGRLISTQPRQSPYRDTLADTPSDLGAPRPAPFIDPVDPERMRQAYGALQTTQYAQYDTLLQSPPVPGTIIMTDNVDANAHPLLLCDGMANTVTCEQADSADEQG